MVKGTTDNQNIGVTLDAGRIGWNKQPIQNGIWKKLIWTFKGSTVLQTFRFEGLGISNENPIYLALLKVEEGNKATNWTPAPEDIDTSIQSVLNTANTAQATANQNAIDMANFVTSFNTDVANLQTQIDGSITSWFYEVAPSTSNEPAVNWTTSELKNIHLGDLYYNTITGYCYRWQVLNNTYSWQRITDTDVTKALNDAKNAQDTADNKRRVFYNTPTPPYDPGDLWVQGSSGDILRCQTVKITGQSYLSSDWIKASKYTDDAVASNAQNLANQAQATVDALTVGGRNLIITSTALKEYWINTSGVVEQSSNANKSAITDYIDILPSTDYTLTRQKSSAIDGGYFRIAWYDENKNYISRAAYGNLETHITSPENAEYIRIAYPYDAYPKFEKGNRATDWSPAPEDVDADINTAANNASKTATNYLNFSSSGLVIGDMTASTLGENVLIDSNSVDIRDGTTTLASFGASTIYLGKNSETSVINLCNGAATMRVKDNTDFRIYTDKRLVMSAYDSMLLDCWRDSTHMTRIAIQSSDPDDASTVGGVQFTIYQDDIQNTVQMLGNDIIHKVTDGTNTTYTTMHESIYKVNTSGTIVLNSPSSIQIGDSSNYSFGIRLGNTFTKSKGINCYWSDNSIHDLVVQSGNGQTSSFGPADIGESTTTNVRGKYVRLYAHSGGAVYLGASGTTAVTSDRNMKKDIVDLDDKYIDFFDRLRPITYKYNDGHRDHIGFVAQEVEEALIASGLTTEQFAGLVIEKDVTLNPNYDSSLSDEENAANETHYETLYSLRYEEFISLLAKKVQNLQKQINEINANN